VFALTENDLVIGTIDGTVEGISIPADLIGVALDRLRLLDGAIVDAGDMDQFYVDEAGTKHVVAGDGRQPLACALDDVLVQQAGVWHVITDSDQLAQVKAEAVTRLTADCAAAIVGGYSSDALGSSHLYPSAITDQINMMGSVTDSLLPGLPAGWSTPFWCADEAGGWAFRPHSAEQIQAAGASGKQHILDCQTRLDHLSAEVAAAASIEAVQAIVWEVA
jgi:hypothetical protein